MKGPASNAGVRTGDLVAGKYRIDKVLGAGGMGVVVAATHVQLDERVAIKFLQQELLISGEAVARFAREARAAVKIKSEHVARVSDVGKLENGAPYMVMEYLEGSDLFQWLKRRGVPPVGQAVEFVLQACEAIAEAHSLGIVHRDLKPANLFVTQRPDGSYSIKVLDFGISKMKQFGSASAEANGIPEDSITRMAAIVGSPLYMSPEQMRSSKDVDARTDIWALGTILYELVTGELPYVADTVTELVALIYSTAPRPIRGARPDAPQALESVIFRCLERERDRRYTTIEELAQALMPFAPREAKISLKRIAGVTRGATRALTVAGAASALARDDQAGGQRTEASWSGATRPRGRATLTLLLAGAGLLLGTAAFFVFRGHAPVAAPAAAESSAALHPSPPRAAPQVAPLLPAEAEDTPAAPASAAASANGASSAKPGAIAATPRSLPKSTRPASGTRASVTAPTPTAKAKAISAFDDRK